MNIERLIGYTHRTPTQFVKGAVVAPRNLVMVETTVIGPRRTIAPYAWILFRSGLQDPAEQTHGAAQLVISICVGRATGYAAARLFPSAPWSGTSDFIGASSFWVCHGSITPAPALGPAPAPRKVRAPQRPHRWSRERSGRLARAGVACADVEGGGSAFSAWVAQRSAPAPPLRS